MTDTKDRKTKSLALDITLDRETCNWLSEPFVGFLSESVQHAVVVEFDRYIEAGDLEKTEERLRKINEQSDESDGFVGMYL